MKKRSVILLIISAAVMILIPLMSVLFLHDECGFGTFFLLFFVIDPLCTVILGALSQKNFMISFLNAMLYLIGTWCFFDFGNTDFLFYAAVYIILGYAAQFIALLIRKLFKNKKTA